ncbi:MAG: LysR family transcriptional regulator [Opitutaceae bacterium]|nr:LysR family transcriptional regulator [Opitutaceae bacterium]
MRSVHDFLKTAPFDIYELHLFHLVAEHRSFTKAAEIAGLTQSAVTRQVQGVEASLGVELFERTTRSVRLTPAGAMLLAESTLLLGSVDQALRRIREEFTEARKIVRVGVSRSVGLAYLPGFFHANLRRAPEVGCDVRYTSSSEILSALEANDLELGVLCPPPRLPKTVRITHRFADAFTLIAHPEAAARFKATSRRQRSAWSDRERWLLLDDATNTGRRLRAWMKRQGIAVDPTMSLDSFDLIINLVALGMGVSFVPIRALALYPSKRTIRRLAWPDRFTRELVVAMRRNRKPAPHITAFVEGVLF